MKNIKTKPLKRLRILISVSNRKGVVDFITGLQELMPVEVVATPGTAKYLEEAGIKIVHVESLTGIPSLFGGRIKMIHLPVFAGILADQNNSEHIKQLKKLKVKPFNMAVVNLYPFDETVKRGAELKEAIEKIDIGGPAALRAGAKNFQSIIVICSPKDYSEVLKKLKKQGNLTFKQRKKLAVKAFKLTQKHDNKIIKYLSGLL